MKNQLNVLYTADNNYAPFFSIIIPSYNSENFILKALSMYKLQKFKNFEIIVTDDASQDASVLLIKKFILENSELNIKLFTWNENKGIAYSKNFGLEKSSGQYVIFNDSDDWPDVDFLEILYYEIQRTSADKIRAEIRVINSLTGKERIRKITNYTTVWTEGMFHATAFRRSIFTDNNISFYIDKNVAEDLYLDTVLNAYIKNFVCIKKPLYNFLFRANSTSGSKTYSIEHTLEVQRATYLAIKPYYEKLDEYNKPFCELLFIKQFYFMIYQYGRNLTYKNLILYYKQLKNIQILVFPNYLKSKKVTLLKQNGEQFFFRAVLWITFTAEKLHFVSLLLLLYKITSKIFYFQTK